MRLFLTFVLTLAVIAPSVGCFITDFTTGVPLGEQQIPGRTSGGKHLKDVYQQTTETFYDKMARGDLVMGDLEAADMPSPAGLYGGCVAGSQVHTLFQGYRWQCFSGYVVDRTRGGISLTNPDIFYNLSIRTPNLAFYPDGRINCDALGMVGQHGYNGSTSPLAPWFDDPNPPYIGQWTVTEIIVDGAPGANFGSGPAAQTIFLKDWDGDGDNEWNPTLGVLVSTGYNTDGPNICRQDGSRVPWQGNGSIKDSLGQPVDSADDLMALLVRGRRDLVVEAKSITHPEFGTFVPNKKLEMTIDHMMGGGDLLLNDHKDTISQLVTHLRRLGADRDESIDLSGTTIDFGGFTYELPAGLVVSPIWENVDRFLADAPSTGETSAQRNRMRR